MPALGTSLEGYGVASLLPERKEYAYFVATLVCLVPFVAVLVQLILVYKNLNPFPFATLFMDSMAITCYASAILLSILGLQKLYQRNHLPLP